MEYTFPIKDMYGHPLKGEGQLAVTLPEEFLEGLSQDLVSELIAHSVSESLRI
ncbi:hypothetical protein KCU36_004290 [Vibrio vulnificus]|nr:hypothetical protein [Vibrio vulnificus]